MRYRLYQDDFATREGWIADWLPLSNRRYPAEPANQPSWCLASGRGGASLARMSETEVLILTILLAVCAALLLVLVLVMIHSARSLRRIERSLTSRDAARESAASAAGAAAPRGEFEAFLAEDPARQLLTKAEQFSSYRRWRQDNGLNWSKP